MTTIKCNFVEDDLRDFENSMTVSDSNGGWGPGGKRKVNCCKVLMKKCLELIDIEASSVLACEDIEDLDVTTLRMIVCRETLCVQSETEVLLLVLILILLSIIFPYDI